MTQYRRASSSGGGSRRNYGEDLSGARRAPEDDRTDREGRGGYRSPRENGSQYRDRRRSYDAEDGYGGHYSNADDRYDRYQDADDRYDGRYDRGQRTDDLYDDRYGLRRNADDRFDDYYDRISNADDRYDRRQGISQRFGSPANGRYDDRSGDGRRPGGYGTRTDRDGRRGEDRYEDQSRYGYEAPARRSAQTQPPTDLLSRIRGLPSWLSSQLHLSPKPLWVLITAHVLVLGIALVLYALPHHVLVRQGTSTGIRSVRGVQQAVATAVPTPAPTPAATLAGPTPVPTPTPEPTPEPEPVGSFRRKFADHFTSGEVERTDTSYRSANVDVKLTTGEDLITGARYYVADIYIADITCLKSALARDTYGNGYSEWPSDIAKRYGSIVTINGDYYGARQGGVVVRNAELLRDEKNLFDVCAIYWDGSMKVFDPFSFDAEAEMQAGCYQAWDFGPMLMDDSGHALASFNSTVNGKNPRSVLGYYEPGHYCFVAVDGRGSSPGMEMAELARLMEELGCVQAYNLDGGQSSQLCAGSRVVNQPYNGGRKTSDVIMILDAVES